MIAMAAISSISSAWRASAMTALIGRMTRTRQPLSIPFSTTGSSIRITEPSVGSSTIDIAAPVSVAVLPSFAVSRL